MNTEPLVFKSAVFPRLWGGRQLSTLFGRELPADGQNYGESWEISDRPEFISEVALGPWKGMNLHQLWTGYREELFGKGYERFERFPLLCKILDACDKLSLQVHPPAPIAKELGGESKTEAWYIAESNPGSSLFSGWEFHVSREEVAQSIADGSLRDLIHELFPSRGDSLFLHSGRIHALGAGIVVFEIQENSDTTYRLYDWNRVDDKGNPRELHVDKAIASLDMEDIRPEPRPSQPGIIADSREFLLEQIDLDKNEKTGLADSGHFALFAIAEGEAVFGEITFRRGDFFVLPRGAAEGMAKVNQTRVLRCTVPPVC